MKYAAHGNGILLYNKFNLGYVHALLYKLISYAQKVTGLPN